MTLQEDLPRIIQDAIDNALKQQRADWVAELKAKEDARSQEEWDAMKCRERERQRKANQMRQDEYDMRTYGHLFPKRY